MSLSAGLTIGQTEQTPGASRLNIKTLLYCFSCFQPVYYVSKLYSFLITACSILVKKFDNIGIYHF